MPLSPAPPLAAGQSVGRPFEAAVFFACLMSTACGWPLRAQPLHQRFRLVPGAPKDGCLRPQSSHFGLLTSMACGWRPLRAQPPHQRRRLVPGAPKD
eukprot:SAG31_NODE_15672_length_743_cov_1.411491_1_plen_96_part_10